MGANEFGIKIGNNAVYTKEKYAKKGGLLGMDLLQLGFERAKTSSEALETIIDLLEFMLKVEIMGIGIKSTIITHILPQIKKKQGY